MDHATKFKGKTVLITGASSGIGREIALQLGKAGARLGVLARREQLLLELAEELGSRTKVEVFAGDIADAEFCERSVSETASRLGGIDLVINNAGVSMNSMFEDAELDVFRRMMDINYFGSLYIAKAAMPHLAKTNGGLVFISSIVGKRGFPTRSGYSAAKFAVHGLFETLRVEWAPKGIYVGIVAPGYTETEIRENALAADGKPRKEGGVTAGDVMSAAEAASLIIAAAARRKREVIMTRGGKLMVLLNKFLPKTADKIAAKVIG